MAKADESWRKRKASMIIPAIREDIREELLSRHDEIYETSLLTLWGGYLCEVKRITSQCEVIAYLFYSVNNIVT